MVKTNRKIFDLSGQKLRRARRLYQFLCAPRIRDKKDYAIICASRAIESGLYAKGCKLGDATFSMERACFKRFGPERSGCGWHDIRWGLWCKGRRENDDSIWEKAKQISRRYPSWETKLRLVL